MKSTILKTESKLLGRNVVKLSGWKSFREITESETKLITEFDPCYVYCEVDATDLVSIHALEEAGYRFSEFRVSSILKTADSEVSVSSFYPFVAEIITEKTVVQEAINILNQNPCDDRFSNDPFIPSDFTAKRNVHNLKKSFRSWPKEFLLGIFNSHTEELIAFRSGAIINKTEAQLFQYSVSASTDFDHTADMLEAFTIQYLKEQGIKHIHAVSTGFNIPELNRLTQNHGFKMVSSHVLLRKVF